MGIGCTSTAAILNLKPQPILGADCFAYLEGWVCIYTHTYMYVYIYIYIYIYLSLSLSLDGKPVESIDCQDYVLGALVLGSSDLE